MSIAETTFDESDASWLLTAKQLAALLQVSLRTLWRMRSAGQVPSPLRFGGTVRWRKDEVLQWIAAGCPTQRKAR